MIKRLSVGLISSVLLFSACGGGESSSDTTATTVAVFSKNAALQVDLGARWVGQTFAATAFKIENLPACQGVVAPAGAGIISGSGTALLGWTGTKSTPPTDTTADMVVLEKRAPTGATWSVIGYTRTMANAIAPNAPGKGAILRVSFYRTTSTPCIGPRSTEVRWVPNVTTNGGG
jgi:hypothetical protein